MKHSEVLSRYVNTGSQIPEEQYNLLSPSLRKSYMRMRGVVGYEDWEFIYLTDDERIKYIEKKGEELNGNNILHLLQYSNDKDLIATKIIDLKGEKLHYQVVEILLTYSQNKDLIITKIIDEKGEELTEYDVDIIFTYLKSKDDFNKIITQVMNVRGGISEDLYNTLSPSLQKSYIKIKGFSIYGYSGWEYNFLNDDEKIKYIENRGKKFHGVDIKHIFKYSENKIDVINKIIQTKKNENDFDDIIYYLFRYSKDKESIKKLLLQNGVNYRLINDVIIDNFDGETPLIPDNYQEMLNEIRRIKEIMR
jgi:hypothetical protein